MVRDQSVLIQRSTDRTSLILRALIPCQAPGAVSDLWEYWRITMEFTKQISSQSMWEKQCQANKQHSPDVALKVNLHAHCVCLNMLWYSRSSLSQSCCSPSCWSQLSGVFELQQEIPARHRPVDSRTWFGLMYSSHLISTYLHVVFWCRLQISGAVLNH